MTLTPNQQARLAMLMRGRDRALARCSDHARETLNKSWHRTIGVASAACGDCNQGAPVGYYRCPVCSAAHEKKWGG